MAEEYLKNGLLRLSKETTSDVEQLWNEDSSFRSPKEALSFRDLTLVVSSSSSSSMLLVTELIKVPCGSYACFRSAR